MTVIEWVEPAPLWTTLRVETINQPRLVHIRSDSFLPDFLAAMASQDEIVTPAKYLGDHVLPTSTRQTLYQPLHGSFYLVTASLVCRQIGLPDKTVSRKRGESVSFVLRRMRNGVEQGWIDEGPNRGWRAVAGDDVLPDEERFPMHPVSVQITGETLQNGFGRLPSDSRVVYHGYLATSSREKYVDSYVPALPSGTTPTQAQNNALVDNYRKTIESQTASSSDPNAREDFRLNEFDTRVLATWSFLLDRFSTGQSAPDNARLADMSLYLILDLGDYLSRALPAVWNAILANSSSGLNRPSFTTLYNTITNTNLRIGEGTSTGGMPTRSLAQALRECKDSLGLVSGGTGPVPASKYNFWSVAIPGTLKTDVKNALADETTPMVVTEEMATLLRQQIPSEPVDTQGKLADYYFLRLIYDYDPDCPPVISAKSQEFRFAKAFDPDAPTRIVRLELPKLSDLRKFKRGVGFQMDPELRRVMDGVNEDMLKGEGLNSAPGWSLGMVCTFSLQIIFLVAFIVMFIFLILLNIVFWWLAFLKICLPIPLPPSSSS